MIYLYILSTCHIDNSVTNEMKEMKNLLIGWLINEAYEVSFTGSRSSLHKSEHGLRALAMQGQRES